MNLRPNRFPTMYNISHGTESTITISNHLRDIDERPEALLCKDLLCVPVICFSDTNSASPLPTGLGSSVSVGKPKSILAIFEMGDEELGRAAGFFSGSYAHGLSRLPQ